MRPLQGQKCERVSGTGDVSIQLANTEAVALASCRTTCCLKHHNAMDDDAWLKLLAAGGYLQKITMACFPLVLCGLGAVCALFCCHFVRRVQRCDFNPFGVLRPGLVLLAHSSKNGAAKPRTLGSHLAGLSPSQRLWSRQEDRTQAASNLGVLPKEGSSNN